MTILMMMTSMTMMEMLETSIENLSEGFCRRPCWPLCAFATRRLAYHYHHHHHHHRDCDNDDGLV